MMRRVHGDFHDETAATDACVLGYSSTAAFFALAEPFSVADSLEFLVKHDLLRGTEKEAGSLLPL